VNRPLQPLHEDSIEITLNGTGVLEYLKNFDRGAIFQTLEKNDDFSWELSLLILLSVSLQTNVVEG